MIQKKVAVFFLLIGICLVIGLSVFDYAYFTLLYATKQSIDKHWYVHLVYNVPSLFVYIFGLIGSWCFGVYFICVSFLFFKNLFLPFFDRIIAGGCAIVLLNLLLAIYAKSYGSMILYGGFLGYTFNNLMNNHFLMYSFIIKLLLVGMLLVVVQFSWLLKIRQFFMFLLGRITCFPGVLWLFFLYRNLVRFWLVTIAQCAKNGSYFLFDAVKARCSLSRKQILIKEYNKILSEIRGYLVPYITNQHGQLLIDDRPTVSLVTPSTMQAEQVIIDRKTETTVGLQVASEYHSIPAAFFDSSANNQLINMLKKEIQDKAIKLEEKLKRFGVSGAIVNMHIGPLVTLFEYEPAVDTKLSKIVTLEDDLAMVLQAMSVRILAPIPGKSVVGFEVANTQRQSVWFKDLFVSLAYQEGAQQLPLILGTDTMGNEIIADLAAMPHLLIAGSTGSGKSVALNSMLISLLSKKSFYDMKLILIDPKRLEFMSYADIPHLIFPIVTHPKKAIDVLKWLVQEMDKRYEKMSQIGVRDCKEYNKKQSSKEDRFPFIVVIIDEFADLMITVKKDIEDLITRISQMARAAGIHMIIATQRPSVDVITGLIKVNFTSRIALRVASKIDSRTILDTNGAERLLAKGDMLFLDGTAGQLKRMHGPYISSAEIERVVKHLCRQAKPMYYDIDFVVNTSAMPEEQEDAVLYKQVLIFIEHTDAISISLLQRKFKIGYNRSARIIEALEHNGLIMPADGSKMRRVIR